VRSTSDADDNSDGIVGAVHRIIYGLFHFLFSLNSGSITDVAALRICATTRLMHRSNDEAMSSFRKAGGLQRFIVSLPKGSIAKLRQSRRDREGGVEGQKRRRRNLRILKPSEFD
jgi:hypothetical protein